MKEIYLAMDVDKEVYGFDTMPTLKDDGMWWVNKGNSYDHYELMEKNIDVTKFPLTRETPIKIRAVWEQVNE